MRLTNKMAPKVLLLICLVAISLTVSACSGLPMEPGLTVRVHNQTDKILKIYNGDNYIRDIAPQGELEYLTDPRPPYKTVTAKDAEGNVVYSANFTQKDLVKDRLGYKYDVYIPPK